MIKNIRDVIKEFRFSTARSGGSGGQHVNKVETKVIVKFDFKNSLVFTDEEKSLIEDKLKNKINKKGEIVVFHETERSQLKNKQKAIIKLIAILTKAIKKDKKRKKTKIPKSINEARLKSKKKKSEIKASRKQISNY